MAPDQVQQHLQSLDADRLLLLYAIAIRPKSQSGSLTDVTGWHRSTVSKYLVQFQNKGLVGNEVKPGTEEVLQLTVQDVANEYQKRYQTECTNALVAGW